MDISTLMEKVLRVCRRVCRCRSPDNEPPPAPGAELQDTAAPKKTAAAGCVRCRELGTPRGSAATRPPARGHAFCTWLRLGNGSQVTAQGFPDWRAPRCQSWQRCTREQSSGSPAQFLGSLNLEKGGGGVRGKASLAGDPQCHRGAHPLQHAGAAWQGLPSAFPCLSSPLPFPLLPEPSQLF